MLDHPIRYHAAILPLYVMVGLLLFRGPGVVAKAPGSWVSMPGSTLVGTNQGQVEPTSAQGRSGRSDPDSQDEFPATILREATESALQFEELPISKEDEPFDAISPGPIENAVPAEVIDRMNRSIHWICTVKKKDPDQLGNGRRFVRARMGARYDLYICLECVVTPHVADMIIVLWDKERQMASSQSRLIRSLRSWILRDGLPKVNQVDLDRDGQPELVLYMKDHNGMVHDATDKHYLSINPDLTLRRSLTLVTHEWDGRPWNPDHLIERTVHPVDDDRLVIRTWRTSTAERSPRSEIGRVLLRRRGAQMPYEAVALEAWDTEDGDEVNGFAVRMNKRRLAAEQH